MGKTQLYAYAVLALVFLLSACSAPPATWNPAQQAGNIDPTHLVEAPFAGKVNELPPILAPQGFDWRQFEAVELNMISENTPPSAALSANIDTFEEATGVKVNIQQMDLVTVIEKVGLDFNARAGHYQIIYADPYQILAKYADHLVDLNTFNKAPALPHIPGGLDDFFQSQLDVVGYMENKDRLLALPFDASTMLLAYRKDIFEKYGDQFMREKGYDWTPGPNLTWEQYYDIAAWINAKVADGTITEVEYGAGHQAERYDPLMDDFSNILAANGGDYFERSDLQGMGSAHPGQSAMTSRIALDSATFYKKLLDIADPGSVSWGWTELAEAFASGDLAMAPEWHDYAAMFETKAESDVVGKVGWTMLPKGKVRHANTFGGTGLAINKYASDREKRAAWLFLIWATSPQTEYMILKSNVGGSTPIRHSVTNLPEVQKGMQPGTTESQNMPALRSMRAALSAWKPENMYIRPKIPQWQQVNTFIFTELSRMLTGRQSPRETMYRIAEESNEATGNK